MRRETAAAILAVILLLVGLCCFVNASENGQQDNFTPKNEDEQILFLDLEPVVPPVEPITEVSTTYEPSYEIEQVIIDYESFDYMRLMIRAAANGDMQSLMQAYQLRNEKIESLGLDIPAIDPFDLIKNFESYAGFSLNTDYMSQMIDACMTGDHVSGQNAAEARNLKIKTLGLEAVPINYDELELLSRVIMWEAGADWLSDEWKIMVGETLLNRVASPEFPSTMYECVYAPRAYQDSHTNLFKNFRPTRSCVDAAIFLLEGNRLINDPSVVFQAGFRQGSGVYIELHDEILGTTYLCHSTYMEHYR